MPQVWRTVTITGKEIKKRSEVQDKSVFAGAEEFESKTIEYSMTHGSLFSGIGGFDLAAEWMGWENKFHCELNPFGQKVLKHYWPCAESFTDITKTDFTPYANRIDILTGGFPCQPYSTAGKRLGKEDARHLWPEMLRAIREIQPRWVVGENVRGLTNWNGGVVFDEVQAELETEGYEVLPFLLPACAVNAPHRRDRIWFIAHTSNTGLETVHKKKIDNNRCEAIADPEFAGLQRGFGVQESIRLKHRAWDTWPQIEPEIPPGNDGIPSRLDASAIFNKVCKPKGARAYGRWKEETIKAAGSAISPQVACQIFKTIEQYETLLL